MIGTVNGNVYWMRLGPLPISERIQAYLHVLLCITPGGQERLRIIYRCHEFLRRDTVKTPWRLSDSVPVPLDASLCQIIQSLVMQELWSLVFKGVAVESLRELQEPELASAVLVESRSRLELPEGPGIPGEDEIV